MSRQQMTLYLNDHLGGSVMALELLQHLETAHAGTPIQKLAAELRVEIAQDQAVVRELIERIGGTQSVVRRAAAWLADKVAALKFRLEDPAKGAFSLLESWETLSLGIEGKRGLWLALETAAATNPLLEGLDYNRLVRRAEEQRRRVEEARLAAAVEVLGTTEE